MDQKKAEILMASVTMAWGFSYLLMKVGLGGIGPFNLIALRFGIAFLFMVFIFKDRFHKLTWQNGIKGIITGILLFCLFVGMVIGVDLTTPSTAGFLMSTTVIIVPVLEATVKRRKPGVAVVITTMVTTLGLYLLVVKESLAIDIGALFCLGAALVYGVYIMVFDRIAKHEDLLLVSIIQLGVASSLGAVFMLLFETPRLPGTAGQWVAIIILGLVCSGYGFVVQPLAQKHIPPQKVGLIFSLEPVFSALTSFIFLHEVFDLKGWIGAALIFSSIVYANVAKPAEKEPIKI